MCSAGRPHGSLTGRCSSIASSAGVPGAVDRRRSPDALPPRGRREGSVTRHLWKLIVVGYWFVILLVTFLRIVLGG
jgi:hypothetical protein